MQEVQETWAKAGYNPWGRKELDTTEQLSEHIHTVFEPRRGNGKKKFFSFILCLMTELLGLGTQTVW